MASHFYSSAAVMLTVSLNSFQVVASSTAMALLRSPQRVGLVDCIAPALVAAHPILRVFLGGTDGAACGLGIRSDLLLDGSGDGAAVAVPLDLVAPLGVFAHAGGIPIDAESIQPRFRCLKRRSA